MSHQFIKLIIFSVQRLKAVSFLAWKWSLMELLIGHWARKGNLIWPSKAGSRILLPLVGSFWPHRDTDTENGDNRILKVEENLCVCVYISLFSHVPLFATPWTVACQAPLSMRLPRQEHWSGLPFSSPGDLPDPGIEPRSHALQAGSLPSEHVCLCACVNGERINERSTKF